jgi:hypothetical protein
MKMTELSESILMEEFDISDEIVNIETLPDGKSTITIVKCNDIGCPYNREYGAILRSNASIILQDEKGVSYTLNEQHSGDRGLCPHNVTHRYITKKYS